MWACWAQYSTVQYSTVQYSTVQYSTVQHTLSRAFVTGNLCRAVAKGDVNTLTAQPMTDMQAL